VSVRIGQADGRVIISVRDEGVGVARAEQASIFRKFARGSAASALPSAEPASASPARQIIDDHGGKIAVESDRQGKHLHRLPAG
jgi:signal transduction histidine kinase